MYETIPAVTSSTNEGSASLEVQTGHCSSTTSVTDMEDSVFVSEKGPAESSASNLDMHPRARVSKDGFYQAPKIHPAKHHPTNYDNHRLFNSGSDTQISSTSASMQHLPVRRQL